MDALETIRAHYTQRDLAARQWKRAGGRVVGYISDDVPEEMIIAAGFLPYRLSGDPSAGTEEADRYTEAFYDPSTRSILNMLLSGRYDFLDFLVIPHHSDSVLKLFHQLWWIRRIEPDISFPPVHLFDILHTRFFSSGLYVREELRQLKAKLEEWSGREIGRSSLAAAIRTVNESRTLLKKIARLRTSSPPCLSGMDALRVTGTSFFMRKEEHTKLVAEILATAEGLPIRKGVRLFAGGSDLDDLQFYEIVESCGACVVAEESSWGESSFRDLVDETGDPLEAIAERYHLRPSRYRTQSLEERVRNCVNGAIEARAEGAVFFLHEWDPAPAWDLPGQTRALEAEGVKTLFFVGQKYHLTEEAKAEMRARVGQLVESLATKGERAG